MLNKHFIIINRFIANKYLIKSNYKGQDVEWAYAFDIHLNAFVPTLVISHIFQLFFYNGMYNIFLKVHKIPQFTY